MSGPRSEKQPRRDGIRFVIDVLFRTIHGSRLYGLDNEDSDTDYYTVIPRKSTKKKKYAKQTINDGVDSMVVDFSTFRVYCDMGVPQALEALFSPVPEVDVIADFRNSYRIDTGAVVERYRRTIKSFSLGEEYKKKRHALRLALNLREAVETGRFNPRLSDFDVLFVSRVAQDEKYFEILESIA